jgi:hypothetical protein
VGAIDLVALMLVSLVTLLSNTGFAPGFTIGVSVFGVIAVGLLIVGGILLRGIARERADYGAQIDRVKAAIEGLTPTPVEPPVNVPPAMPFPQQVMGPSPWIAVTLARF